VWSELGLAAAAALIVSIVVVLAALWRAAWLTPPGPSCSLLYVLIAVFLFTLMAAQVSGDLNENRAFWASFGLAWLIIRHGMPAGVPVGRATRTDAMLSDRSL
jgi:hypothetical protein